MASRLRINEPRMTATGKLNPEMDTVIGEVPKHFRHLHNLLVEVADEMEVAKKILWAARNRREAVHAISFDSLETHVPSRNSDYDGVKFCNGWKVAGSKHGESDLGSLGKVLGALVMGGRNNELRN